MIEQVMDYQPQHLEHYDESRGHCCFGGCTSMGCSGGCCIRGMGHRSECPRNPFRIRDDALSDIYVVDGMPKHLRIDPFAE